jgi:hypothetical protein
VLIFFIAGLLYLIAPRVDNLGAYRIPPETGILIPSGFDSYRAATFRVMQKKSRPYIERLCRLSHFALPVHSPGAFRTSLALHITA